ncbi:hypothetical protein P43SY_011694 [Pythium insidiosum]|uniref:Uncharacterized protein n=1 Tax=Pythium insidiosum TaxID=114742 RepID=A0AAD5Q1X2_PYTIN|nr:hypothetical protein P43SY_011694 [Pythium insidiosum]
MFYATKDKEKIQKPFNTGDPTPSPPAVVKAAAAMNARRHVAVFRTNDENLFRVKQMELSLSMDGEEGEQAEMSEQVGGIMSEAAADPGTGIIPAGMVLGPELVLREERERANALYLKLMKTPLCRVHLIEMPTDGWIVNVHTHVLATRPQEVQLTRSVVRYLWGRFCRYRLSATDFMILTTPWLRSFKGDRIGRADVDRDFRVADDKPVVALVSATATSDAPRKLDEDGDKKSPTVEFFEYEKIIDARLKDGDV